MSNPNDSIWGSINTLFEIGLEVYKLMSEKDSAKGSDKGIEVQKISDGVLLMSNDKDVLIAVSKEAASGLSDAALSRGKEKGDYICYTGAMAAIPLFEFSQNNENIRNYIVSDESLRATLCGNYPEYVKSWNMAAPPDAKIKDADAPLYMFLQKQLDNAADQTRAEVAEYQMAHAHEVAAENSRTDEVLELER